MMTPTESLLRIAFDSQYFAAISTLRAAAIFVRDNDLFLEPIATRPCWEALLHTAYFTHFYLTPAAEPHPEPPAWANKDALSFGWSWDPPYTRVDTGDPPAFDPLLALIDETLDKARTVISNETEDTLNGPSGFDWLPITRAEHHIYNIRHAQHHSAQIEAMLRKHDLDPQWIGRRKGE
ncbi:MAG: DinB family protein [Planctomycetota bacterium]